MEHWLSIAELARQAQVAETTLRRWLNIFDRFFRYEQRSRGNRYAPDSVELVRAIQALYGDGLDSIEINKVLEKQYAFVADDGNNEESSTTTQPPASILDNYMIAKIDKEEFLEKVELVVQQLVEQRVASMKEQLRQEVRADLLLNVDQKLDQQRSMEYAIKKQLEQEALQIWNDKPWDERSKKVGWFKRQEDEFKRDRFMRLYINENLETRLQTAISAVVEDSGDK